MMEAYSYFQLSKKGEAVAAWFAVLFMLCRGILKMY